MRYTLRLSFPLAMALLMIASLGLPASAAPAVGGYGVLTLVGTPSSLTCQGQHCYQITFKNNLAIAIVPVLVLLVVHNAAGQTVLIFPSTVNFDPSATASAYLLVYGLGPGTYNATFFATSSGGVGISSPGSITFTM